MIDNIDLRHLRSFLAVASASSITKAAATQHITQQSLSAHIQQLERALGVTLLVRTSRGITLTAAGAELASGAPDLLVDLGALARRVRATVASSVRRLRVVSAAYTITLFAVEVAKTMEAADPGIEIEVATALRPIEAMQRLHAGTSDAAILWLPTGDPGLLNEPIRDDPRVVLLAEDHRLADRTSLTLADLADDPVVIVDAFASPEALSHRIVDPRPDGRPAVRGPVVPTLEDCQAQLRRGRGVWFAPRQMAEWALCPGVTLIPVVDIAPTPLAVVWPPSIPRDLVDTLVAAARASANPQ
ncbi:MAG: transcriptional regulator, LysR family [Nocardia sp.]|uniref:LysR family transcriptional regulator n=1 Tax=Nocardia sp. TaxID=1821 RepID=UPI002610568E|nr:LysR family transcriptional regulator [Nocardia sp.]MCU1642415.1 transcriptional regulator, LysR family [Nocardia sp.]